ncbi:major facilitator superfamily protein [Actinidia rufa]|uniref:Major facilitator superfamily protein n=1 Tax=Actinidia rufa TaxID=165716 RepID=A0A7J0DTS0_9ERIC|nr:major facilitator superfamily protein [Actinidia rufa]
MAPNALPQTQPKLRGRRRPRLRPQPRLLRLTLPRRHRLLLERRPKGTTLRGTTLHWSLLHSVGDEAGVGPLDRRISSERVPPAAVLCGGGSGGDWGGAGGGAWREAGVAAAVVCLVGVTAGVAIADVTIDACVARNSIEVRELAPDMQSLCGFCSSVGALVGFSTSGFFVHHLGPQGALGVLAIPPAALIVLGFVIYEPKTNNNIDKKQAGDKLGGAMKGMYRTIQFPQVWKPSLYMYLSLALSISTHEGQFYWYTDPKAGPAFSQEFVGMIYAIGAMASIVGVLIYHKTLKDLPFRNLLFFAQLLYGLTGMLDLIFISRWNLILGIPDSFFVIVEECVSRIVSRIRWMPMIVLSTRLCPLGIEGTFFALLMCIDSFGSLSSKWGGGVVLHLFHVTRNDFKNLWLVVLIRNILRIATLGLIFLIPNANPSEVLVPADLLGKTISTGADDDDNLQLVPSNEKCEV